MNRYAIRINSIRTRRPCHLCGQSFRPDDYAVVDALGTSSSFLCDDCIEEHAPDLAQLLAGYALDMRTSDDPYASQMAWLRAFADLGVMAAEDLELASALVGGAPAGSAISSTTQPDACTCDFRCDWNYAGLAEPDGLDGCGWECGCIVHDRTAR